MKYYIVGYGSLISNESRSKTQESGDEFPIKIKGFKRSWNIQVDNSRIGKTTFLGINKNKNYWFNGSLVEIKKNSLVEFDKREKSYVRHLLNKEEIEFYDKNMNDKFDFDNSKIYVYLNKKEFEGFPTGEYLISQAYIDICIIGGLNFSEQFVNDFIKTTYHWSQHIRYNRKEQSKHIHYSKEQLAKVDLILKENNLF